MRRVLNALRIFFLALFNNRVAQEVDELLHARGGSAKESPAKPQPAAAPQPPRPKKPCRSEALTLLATLQREGRLVDFLQESLAGYDDARIGAAARDVHRGCAAVLERLFALQPVVTQEEGAEIELSAGYDVGRFRLTGNVTGQPPFRGRLVHQGWQATRCELPSWTGRDDAALVVAAAEVELPG